MKIQELIKLKGIQKVFEECNSDLRDVREYLIRECNLPKGYDLSRVMKDFKMWVNSTYTSVGSKNLDELFQKLVKEN